MNSSIKIPIKVEPAYNRTTNIVEWMIGNTCNYDCSFCPSVYKSGSQRFLDIEVYKKTVDKIIEGSGEKKIWFKITGGEPTLFPKLVDLLSYIKSTGNYTYVISNGSRTNRYWTELRDSNVVDIIAFTYHPEQTNSVDRMIDTINVFSDAKTLTLVNITCAPKYFNDAVEAYNLFKVRCRTIVNLMNINDSAGIAKYTGEQQAMFAKYVFTRSDDFDRKVQPDVPNEHKYHNGILRYTYDDGSTKTDHASNFMKRYEDNFFGYNCYAGINCLRINYETMQRAVCGVGERWSIYDDKLFMSEPVKCTQTTCQCTMDIIQPKYKDDTLPTSRE